MNKPNVIYSTTFTRMLLPGFVFLVYIMLTACRNDQKDIDALVSKTNTQEDKAEDVTFIYSEYGHTKARLYSKEFVRNDIAKPPFIDMKKGLKIEFFNDSLQVDNTVTARYARYYEQQGNALIRDSVVVVNKKGERLKTEELIWNQNAKKFYTEKFVHITTPEQIMYGDGLEANEDFSWYIIKHPKGIVQVNKSDVPE